MNKDKRQRIRSMILEEYKQKINPHDTSLKIQKLFGYNFETRLSTIRMWFEQFFLGDESLENEPFREDLMPKKRETRKRKCTDSGSTTTDSNSPNVTQTKLLFQLKDQVDVLYRKINAQDCCLQLVDRFLKKMNPNYYIPSDSDSDQNTLGTFYTNYRFLRRKCQKVPLNVNRYDFYEILYDNLYPHNKQKRKKNEKTKKKNSNNNSKRTRKIFGRTNLNKTARNKLRNITGSKNLHVKNRKTYKRKHQNNESEWPKLPIQDKTGHSELTDKLRCPVVGCLHVATSQKMFTIHQSTHVDHSVPISKDQEQLPARCDECLKVFKNRFRLKIHIKQIHENTERWACPLEGCTSAYSRKATLYRHIQIVHTKDAKMHSCTWENCSYTTHNTDMMRKHQNVHTGERPYKCVWPGCDKAFKSNSALAFHKSIHKNERQYKCHWPGCDYACNLSHNLRKHTAIHERKQMQLKEPT